MRRFFQTVFDVLFKDNSNLAVRYPKWFRWLVGATTILFIGNLYTIARYLPGVAPPSFLTADRFATIAGSFAGTVIGAWLAFLFAARSRQLVRDDEEVAAGNLALFALTSMFNSTWQYQQSVTGPYRQRYDAWLNLPATAPLNESFNLDRKALGFIAREEPNVFQTIVLEEVRYDLLTYSVKHHRDLVLNKVWPVLANVMDIGSQMLETEVRKKLGPALSRDLEVTTTSLIENVDENVQSIPKAFDDLRATLKRLHPRRKFLLFRFPSNSDQPS